MIRVNYRSVNPGFDPTNAGNLNRNLNRGAAFPYVLGGLAGLAGGFNNRAATTTGNNRTTGTTTQRNRVDDPLIMDIRNKAISEFDEFLTPGYVEGITAQRSLEADRVGQLQRQTVGDDLARRIDPSSPAYEAALRNVDNQRFGEISRIRSEGPILQQEIRERALTNLSNFLANSPIETTSTVDVDTINTGETTQPGNVAGGILTNALDTFTGLTAADALTSGTTAGGGGAIAAGIKTAGAAIKSGVVVSAKTVGSALGLGTAAGAAILGGGFAAAVAIPWLKSQAHWEANDIVQNFQNPFGDVIHNTAAMVDSGQMGIQAGIDFLEKNWDTYKNETNAWAGNSSDRKLVRDQSHETLSFVEQLIQDWKDFLEANPGVE